MNLVEVLVVLPFQETAAWELLAQLGKRVGRQVPPGPVLAVWAA
jgi:hypothetical protein